VEDDADVRVLLAMTLEMAGYRVTPAPDAEQALQCLERAEAIDLVLTDYGLPAMQGDALIRRLRALPHPLPAILMSAHPDLARIARACQADAVFHKGNPILELLAIVQGLCPVMAR
jgi:CheY-like chemotaxis protein